MPSMCQNCGARKTASGAKLRVCSGCKIDCYCSQTCQTADWARHKAHCRRVRTQERDEPVRQRVYAAIGAWTKKHFHSLLMIALVALNVNVDSSVGAHTVFMLDVRLRPGETAPAQLFDVLDAYAHPMARFSEADRVLYRGLYEEEEVLRVKRHAGDTRVSGVYLLCIREVDTNTVSATPHTFFVYVAADTSRIAWKERLLRCLNEGRVCRVFELLDEILDADVREMRSRRGAAGAAL